MAFFGLLLKMSLLSKSCCGYFWAKLEKFDYFLFQHLVTLPPYCHLDFVETIFLYLSREPTKVDGFTNNNRAHILTQILFLNNKHFFIKSLLRELSLTFATQNIFSWHLSLSQSRPNTSSTLLNTNTLPHTNVFAHIQMQI